MARKSPKKRKDPSQSSSSASPKSGGNDSRLSEANTSGNETTKSNQTDSLSAPPTWLATALSIFVIFHLAALAISFGSVAGSSSLQTSLLDTAQPYLDAAHFSAGGLPYYLAYGTTEEQPHRLQITTDREIDWNDDSQWKTIDPSGVAGGLNNDRYARWMSMVASFAESEEPSLVAQMILPFVIEDESIQAVRIIRLPTELTTVEDDAMPPPYVARVSRSGENTSLVQILSPRLVTMNREGEPSEAKDE